MLAAALAELKARAGSGAGWRWVLVGDGPYRPRIAGAIDAAGLASQVHLAGRVAESELARAVRRRRRVRPPDAVPGQLARHARGDGARQAGRRYAGRRPARQGAAGETGWLVEPGAASALAGALAEALAAPAGTLADLGAAGRRLVEEAFAWPVVAAQLEALYAELLTRSGRR